MLKRILVALDGSENAEKALPWAKRLAGRDAAQVVLFTALPVDQIPPEQLAYRAQEARDYLARMERVVNYEGIPCRTLVRAGKPAETIARAAWREKCDLILMTTRGGSPVKRWLVGGVTERVLRLSRVPVFTIRSQTELPKQPRVRRIVVPVDGSRLAETAVPWARKLARLLRAKIHFLHVAPERGPDARYHELRRRLLPVCAKLREEGIHAAVRLQRGDAAERILVASDRHDLILTTTHGAGGLRRWILGSVAEKLIQGAAVPVIVHKSSFRLRAFGAAS